MSQKFIEKDYQIVQENEKADIYIINTCTVTNMSDRKSKKKNRVKVSIFNTGETLNKEEKMRIWNRFYKVDESRNRDDGGIGIGLAFVKAIMNNYGNDYGVVNKDNGVEFYFELQLVDEENSSA